MPVFLILIALAAPALAQHGDSPLVRALGIEDTLTQYRAEGCRKALALPDPPVRCIALRQRITHAILLASIEASALIALLSSEEERADQAAGRLADRETRIANTLTALALAVGAAGAVATGFTGNDKIGIGTGLTEAGLGLRLLTLRKKTFFSHPRNPLANFWYGRHDAPAFTPRIWAYLDETPDEEHPQLSVRAQLMRTWTDLHGIGATVPEEARRLTDLLMGTGGIYTREQLRLRSDLLDQLAAVVGRMNDELRALLAEVQFFPEGSP